MIVCVCTCMYPNQNSAEIVALSHPVSGDCEIRTGHPGLLGRLLLVPGCLGLGLGLRLRIMLED